LWAALSSRTKVGTGIAITKESAAMTDPSKETVDLTLEIRAAVEAAMVDLRSEIDSAMDECVDELMRKITDIVQAAIDRPATGS
jgi:hypothetical protein